MAAGGAEEHFAKKLANNEKIIRDRAVNKLRAWIRSRPKNGPGTVVLNYKMSLLVMRHKLVCVVSLYVSYIVSLHVDQVPS